MRGLKEYYGTAVEHLNVNDWSLRATLKRPDAAWQTVAAELTAHYAPAPADRLAHAWEQAALALEVYPWDVSWRLRLYNTYRYDQHSGAAGYWDCGWLQTLPTPWTTPSWESSRRGFYVTSDFGTPRLLAETDARFARCIDHIMRAEGGLDEALAADLSPALNREIVMQRVSLTLFRLMARMRQLHLQASRAADALRTGDTTQSEALGVLLAADSANAREMLAIAESTPWQAFDLEALRETLVMMEAQRPAYDADPVAWCRGHLP